MSGCPGWEAVNPLCRAGEALGNAGKSIGNDMFGSIADYFAGAANTATEWLWRQLNIATSVDLTTTSVKNDLIATGAIAAIVTFAVFMVQVIASVLRQDSGGLGRAVRGIGVAFIGATFAIASTQILLAAVDALCNGVTQFALGTDLAGLGSKLVIASTLATIGNPAVLLLVSLVLIASVAVVWVALMIRKMLIVISAVFAPIAFSGAASDVSRSWVKRWIEFTFALVFSKLVLVIIFMIGLSVLDGATAPGTGSGGTGSGGGGQHLTASVTNVAVGSLTLLLAGFAPWIAIKMVHFAGDSFHAVHAQAATAASGARSVVAAPQKVASTAQRSPAFASAGASSGGAGQSAMATAAQGKSDPPTGGGSSGPPTSGLSAGGAAAGGAPAGGASAGAAAGAVPVATGAVAAGRFATSTARTAGQRVAAATEPPRTVTPYPRPSRQERTT